MKKILNAFLIALMLVFVSCSSDEPNEDIVFDVDSNSSPESIHVTSGSPDPGCGIQVMCYVVADSQDGDVEVKCSNYTSVAYTRAFTPDEELGYTVALEGNVIKLHFNELNVEGDYCYDEWIPITATNGDKKTSSYVQVVRTSYPYFEY